MSTNHLRDHGRAVLLVSAVANLPPGLPLDKPYSWVFEIGANTFARATISPLKGANHVLQVSFDGDRARAIGTYNAAAKIITVRRDHEEWPAHQKRAADWLNSQLLRLHQPSDVRIEGVVT